MRKAITTCGLLLIVCEPSDLTLNSDGKYIFDPKSSTRFDFLPDILPAHTVLLVNKIDTSPGMILSPNNKLPTILTSLTEPTFTFREKLNELLVKTLPPAPRSLWTRPRHLSELQAMRSGLQFFNVAHSQNLDIRTEGLRQAMEAAGRLCGQVTSEDVLTEVFSKFCIGK